MNNAETFYKLFIFLITYVVNLINFRFLHRQNANEQALAHIAENYRRTLEEMGIDIE